MHISWIVLGLHHQLLLVHHIIGSHHNICWPDVILRAIASLAHLLLLVPWSILTGMSATYVVVSSACLINLWSIWAVLHLLLQGILVALCDWVSLHALSAGWLTFPILSILYLASLLKLLHSSIVSKSYLLCIITLEKVVLSVWADARVFEVNHVSTLLHLVELLVVHVEVLFTIIQRIGLATPHLAVFVRCLSATSAYVIRIVVVSLLVKAGLWNMPLIIVSRVIGWITYRSGV